MPGTKRSSIASKRLRAAGERSRDYAYYLELPLLRHSQESPLPCRETPAAFEAVNSSFSATVHALFDAFHDFEKLSKTHDGNEFIRKGGLELDLHVVNQSFDRSPGGVHRVFHSRRLFLREHEEGEEINDEYADQGGGDEEQERDTGIFPTEPLQYKIEPLLLAFTAALKSMPALEGAELFTYLAWQPSQERQLEYEGSDEKPYNREDRAIHRWGVGAWRPGDNVTQLFDALDGEDGKVEIMWKPFEYMIIRD
ncbi:uncharacterized protein JN550_008993 [Neoarthrinium moseri]|uniref:uncharacterized protein n=1 Tax=Neoarthrinium moseri TaxID=1658444 RepID=UPI001FDDB587|nr:uncharacterized protein JN550_008993 [Neoarthrinium moseri]KAI1864436.1 hypothetical protein JN550_008993 [Neoarthrinium moseri]